MSSEEKNFVSLALAGEVMMDEIDDFIERWHETPSPLSLHDYLGFTREEYGLWLTSPDMLALILASRKFGKPLDTIANDNLQSLRLAARADDKLKIKCIQDWLQNRHNSL